MAFFIPGKNPHNNPRFRVCYHYESSSGLRSNPIFTRIGVREFSLFAGATDASRVWFRVRVKVAVGVGAG
eukprot:683822-Amorphochlora_amoeboformis.AAC.1